MMDTTIDKLIARAEKLATEGGTPEVATALALVAIAKMMKVREIHDGLRLSGIEDRISRTLPYHTTTLPDYEVGT
jgi:hypothetical protein